MLIDDDLFFLEINKSEASIEDNDPSHYLYVTTGNVMAQNDDQREILAGKFRLYYVDVCAALNAGASVFDVFDCESAIIDYFEPIFNYGTLDISEKLLKLFKYDSSWGNVLILDRLEILPPFRARNVGLIVMRRLIERFGAGAAVVAIKPFPLQCERVSKDSDEWRDSLRLADFDKDIRRSTAKLRRYYAKLGFKAMKGTPFMFRLADSPLPSPESLQK